MICAEKIPYQTPADACLLLYSNQREHMCVERICVERVCRGGGGQPVTASSRYSPKGPSTGGERGGRGGLGKTSGCGTMVVGGDLVVVVVVVAVVVIVVVAVVVMIVVAVVVMIVVISVIVIVIIVVACAVIA